MRSYKVIDADSHVNPMPDFWAEYLPARFRDRAPRFERTDDMDYVIFEGKRAPFSRLTNQAGTSAKDQKNTGKLSDTRSGGWDAAARLADMDTDGVDATAIFGGGPLSTVDMELYIESFSAYNRWIGDFCSQAPDRLFGMAYIPMVNVDAALAELKRAAGKGLKGVVIPPFAPVGRDAAEGINGNELIMRAYLSDERNYANEEFALFWKTASDLNMPLHIHLGAARRAETTGADQRYITQIRSKFAMGEVVTHFIMTGILHRFPDLKLVCVESGVGWMAFAAEYLDNTWHKHRYSTNSPIKIEPSTYFDRQVYGTFLEDAAGVQNINLKGGHNIMWSSDYPHSETTWPNSRASIERSLAKVSAADREAIVSGTARRLYGL